MHWEKAISFFFHAFPFVFPHIFLGNNNPNPYCSTVFLFLLFLYFSFQDLIVFILINNSMCYHPTCCPCTVQQNNAWTTIWNLNLPPQLEIVPPGQIYLQTPFRVCILYSRDMYIVLMGKSPEHYFHLRVKFRYT